MTGLLSGIGLVLVPTWIACGIAIYWAQNSASVLLGRILLFSGIIWLVILTLSFGLLIAPPAFCDGNVLYGYHGCTTFPSSTVTAVSGAALVIYGIGILYAAALLVIGGIWEIVARTNEH